MNAGGREVVSNGRVGEMSMNDYAAFEGMRKIITKSRSKNKSEKESSSNCCN